MSHQCSRNGEGCPADWCEHEESVHDYYSCPYCNTDYAWISCQTCDQNGDPLICQSCDCPGAQKPIDASFVIHERASAPQRNSEYPASCTGVQQKKVKISHVKSRKWCSIGLVCISRENHRYEWASSRASDDATKQCNCLGAQPRSLDATTSTASYPRNLNAMKSAFSIRAIVSREDDWLGAPPDLKTMIDLHRKLSIGSPI